jgi:hypothetical protein
MRVLRNLLALSVLAAMAASCKVEPPPPPPPPPTGPQTKEEVLALVRPVITPIRLALETSTGLSDQDRTVILQNLRQAVAEHGGKDFGRLALREVGYEIAQIGKDASTAERWKLALFCVDAFDTLSMESVLLSRISARAQEMMAQPTVRVRGFLEDGVDKTLYVFMDITDRRTGEVKKVQAREGEEFNGLRMIKVLGRNKQVRFEYIKIPGLIFDVDFEPNNP